PVSGKMAGAQKLAKSTFHQLDPPKTPIRPPNGWSNRAENQYDPGEGLAQVRAEVRYRRQYDLAEIRCVVWPNASSSGGSYAATRQQTGRRNSAPRALPMAGGVSTHGEAVAIIRNLRIPVRCRLTVFVNRNEQNLFNGQY